MQITATELKLNLGKYLNLVHIEDIFITKNGKVTAKLVNPNVSQVDYLSGVLKGKVSEDVNRHSLREERLADFEVAD